MKYLIQLLITFSVMVIVGWLVHISFIAFLWSFTFVAIIQTIDYYINYKGDKGDKQ